MYKFKSSNPSAWLANIYNEFIDYKTDGFLVEIGVGHTIGFRDVETGEIHNINHPNDLDRLLASDHEMFCGGSNTADMLDLGWSGIYIEPIEEFCREASFRHPEAIESGRLSIVCAAASDTNGTRVLYGGESLVPNDADNFYVGRPINTIKTSTILDDNNCPARFDLMSIDVEGWEAMVLIGMDFDRHRPKLIVSEVAWTPYDYIESLLPDSYLAVNTDGLNMAWVDTSWRPM
jgi:hypothetical protein